MYAIYGDMDPIKKYPSHVSIYIYIYQHHGSYGIYICTNIISGGFKDTLEKSTL